MKPDFSKLVDTDLVSIPVMESFHTLQGEGFHTGKPAFFIRTAGCDVGCHWCDVKESWEVSDDQKMMLKDLVAASSDQPSEIVVITGGEPMIYDMDLLTAALQSAGKKTHVETSGVYPLTGNWDWICFSPKKFKPARPEFYQQCDELKVIVYNQHDLVWAETHAEQVSEGVRLFLQPEWSRRQEMIPLIVEYVKENPKWRISLQSHKYLDIP